MNHRVFICYASEDKPTADAVCAILQENRVRCWIAPRDVLPAEDYGQAIVYSISASRLVVFVFSEHANASPHVQRELEGAVSHGFPILPFRIEDANPSDSLQYYLGGIHWLDALTSPLEAHLQHLAGTVRVLLDRNERAPSGDGREEAQIHALGRHALVQPQDFLIVLWPNGPNSHRSAVGRHDVSCPRHGVATRRHSPPR